MPLTLADLRAATPPPDPTKHDISTRAEPPADGAAGSFESNTRGHAPAREGGHPTPPMLTNVDTSARACTGHETLDRTQPDTPSRAGAPARNGPTMPGPALDWCLLQYEQRHGGFPARGGRNAWLTALAFFCNEKGVPQTDLEGHAAGYAGPDFTADEIARTVRGIYQREAAHHNSKPWEPPTFHPAIGAEQPAAGAAPVAKAVPLNTPTIPPEVYQLLPEFLQQCCQPLPTARERDVLLTGALAVLSGCFPTLEGQYRGPVIGANVYAFIVAPAASGKGALNWARKLAWPHHLAVREASQRERDAYEMQLQEYEQQKRTTKTGAPLPPKPVEPARRRLFIAADNGAANVVKTLAENEERGIICETEADALTGALKQDFGDYSALLRKCSEHEPHQYDRKTAGTYELSRPALSVAIGGTPEQVNRLIPSAEDGLFSRFWFYAFEAPHEWDNPFAVGGPNLDTWFERLSVRVSEMIAAAAAGRILVELTEAQQARFNAAWQQWLSEGVADFGEGSGSAVKRHARACFRLCMLLTLLRCFDNGEAPAGRTLTCEDDDLTAALLIADVYRCHALALYERLPRPVGSGFRQPTKYAGKAVKEAQVLALHTQGLSLREIEAQTGIPFSTVRRWVG
ncbi:DUF3987 domain-containing protein [Hymenobacter sediminicola]|uniref:DUF3987 domain-containing protein n=1 Tax=Hymenobacter sediminicola TaxID=2761579 RepID=A0A7G7W3Q6_9BACT|nr:DUF3987 domain-containing protein [Hymenobacter sediminicola]QNH60999.1 DUF3987 domain-containing protein [Hymenobacter sediminicola]